VAASGSVGVGQESALRHPAAGSGCALAPRALPRAVGGPGKSSKRASN